MYTTHSCTKLGTNALSDQSHEFIHEPTFVIPYSNYMIELKLFMPASGTCTIVPRKSHRLVSFVYPVTQTKTAKSINRKKNAIYVIGTTMEYSISLKSTAQKLSLILLMPHLEFPSCQMYLCLELEPVSLRLWWITRTWSNTRVWMVHK